METLDIRIRIRDGCKLDDSAISNRLAELFGLRPYTDDEVDTVHIVRDGNHAIHWQSLWK